MPQRLVSPDLKLYIVAGPEALRDLVKVLKLGWVLGGNLQQLCGWAEVGADRTDRKEAGNWQLLESVRWLKHDNGNEIVPVVGKYSHMFKSVVQLRADMDFPQSSLEKLLRRRFEHLKGWRLVEEPAGVRQLLHGDSLKGFFDVEQSNVQVHCDALCVFWLDSVACSRTPAPAHLHSVCDSSECHDACLCHCTGDPGIERRGSQGSCGSRATLWAACSRVGAPDLTLESRTPARAPLHSVFDSSECLDASLCHWTGHPGMGRRGSREFIGSRAAVWAAVPSGVGAPDRLSAHSCPRPSRIGIDVVARHLSARRLRSMFQLECSAGEGSEFLLLGWGGAVTAAAATCSAAALWGCAPPFDDSPRRSC